MLMVMLALQATTGSIMFRDIRYGESLEAVMARHYTRTKKGLLGSNIVLEQPLDLGGECKITLSLTLRGPKTAYRVVGLNGVMSASCMQKAVAGLTAKYGEPVKAPTRLRPDTRLWAKDGAVVTIHDRGIGPWSGVAEGALYEIQYSGAAGDEL